MTKTHQAAGLPGELEGLHATSLRLDNLQEALRESAAQGGTGPLRAWAYEQGEAASRSGISKQALVDEMLSVAGQINGRLPAACNEEASVASTLTVAAIEGYSAGGDRVEA